MKEINKNKLVEYANRLKKQSTLSIKQSKEDKAKHKASFIKFKETYVRKTESGTTNLLIKEDKRKKKRVRDYHSLPDYIKEAMVDINKCQFKAVARAYFKYKASKLRAEKKKSKRDAVKKIKYDYLINIGLKSSLAA